MNILYYITSHGFGHAVRTAAICNEIDKKISITIRSGVSNEFFVEEIDRAFKYSYGEFDCGCVQKDGVTVDMQKTLEKYNQIAKNNKTILTEEIAFVKNGNFNLIISDSVPFAFEVAKCSGIKSIAVGNFSWVDIYEPYTKKYPKYKEMINEIATQYSLATYLFRLEPSNEMTSFTGMEYSFPVVTSKGRADVVSLKKRYVISGDKKLAAIYIGNFGLEGVNWSRLKEFSEWEFFGVYRINSSPSNFHLIDKSFMKYRDVIASMDIVIGKIGYGTYCESVANNRQLIYLPRDNFSEHSILEKSLIEKGLAIKLSEVDFKNMDIRFALKQLKLNNVKYEKLNGAKKIAKAIENI